MHGVAVGDLDSATRQRLDIPANVNGALITRAQPNSPADEAGLHERDVILAEAGISIVDESNAA